MIQARRKVEALTIALNNELVLLSALIKAREQELDRLRMQAMQLDDRLIKTRKQLAEVDRMLLDELIVMCHTPCWRYRVSA